MILASIYPSQTISPSPTLPLNSGPYIVTFHLVSGDLSGGHNKNKLLKNAISLYFFFPPFLRKHFLAMAWQEKEKNIFLCDV